MIQHSVLAVALSLCLIQAVSAEETPVLEPVKDNTLFEHPSGGLSNGAGPVFFTGRTNQPQNSVRRGLIAFNVAGVIPAGATVTSAQVTLHVSRAAAGGEEQPVTLHRVRKEWGEGTSSTDRGRGAPATPGDATWIHAFFDTIDWADPGGDFTAEASAANMVGAEGAYTWSSSSDNQLVADVQRWLDDPAGNFGWLVRGNEQTGATTKAIGSREASNAAMRPTLAITFTPPGPATAEPK